MSAPNDGGPAFPLSRSHFGQDGKLTSTDWLPGMSLRDWFAGQALCGDMVYCPGEDNSALKPHEAASRAYEYADAMLAERAKGQS